VFATTHPAAKLMQLREAESLGIFNQHYSCVRYINPDLENGRGVLADQPAHRLLGERRAAAIVGPGHERLDTDTLKIIRPLPHPRR